MPTTATDAHTTVTSPGGTTMRAIAQQRYGTAAREVLSLVDGPRPAAGPGEVLVQVSAGSVDMGTWHCMSGMPYAMRLAGFGVRAPKALNPGRAFAGTVAAVGSGVEGLNAGDAVYGTADGAFADHVVASAAQVAIMPANLTFEQAAAAPISGVTALQAVRKAGVRSGQRVLVVGASGGVGSFAVQLAKSLGAEVTAVCSTSKVDLVRSLGADHVVDYTRDALPTEEPRFDVVLAIGGDARLSALRRTLRPRGTLLVVGSEADGRFLGGFGRSLSAAALSPFVSQTLGMLMSTENAADLDELRSLIESGEVVPTIDRTFPLADTADAIDHVRDGHARGKVVISI